MNWTPIGWLRSRGERLRRRAEAEQNLSDAELLLAEVRKRAAIQKLELRLSLDEVREILFHDQRLAGLARKREFAAALDAFYRDHVAPEGRELLAVPASPQGSRAPIDGDSPLELVLGTFVTVSFLILVYFLW